MKAYFSNLSTGRCALIAVSLAALAYPAVAALIQAIMRTVVPEVVRNMLSLI